MRNIKTRMFRYFFVIIMCKIELKIVTTKFLKNHLNYVISEKFFFRLQCVGNEHTHTLINYLH